MGIISEVVSDYIDLGIKMNYANNFAKAMKEQLDQGRKPQFSILVKVRKLEFIDIQGKLFEWVVFTTVLYGCKVWGFQNIHRLDLFNRKYFKKVLKLKLSTRNCSV